jgi:uncharacterized membrane protein YjgN (DUF898 family)
VVAPLITFVAAMIPLGSAYYLNRPTILLLLPFTVTPAWIWFFAKKQRFFWDHTRFGQARFHSTMTPRALLNLKVGNFLLLVITLGLAWPWTIIRSIKFQLQNLSLIGFLDAETISQEEGKATVTSEGLANLLDSGFELD